jgi:hypothetical protein
MTPLPISDPSQVVLTCTAQQPSTAKSSSSAVTSSSSGGSQLVHSVLLVSENLDAVVQMRRLDGSKVLDTKSATPGIYYVKTAGGVWMKKLVLRK